MSTLKLKHFYDEPTFTLTYLVYDEKSSDAVIIDPVLDYDPASSVTSTESIDKLMDFIGIHNLKPTLILETHAHADHLTGASELKKRIPEIKIGISNAITSVQKVFKKIYNNNELKTDGSQFELLLEDDQVLSVGSFDVRVIKTPGHTPACVSFLVEDMLFTGDALFMPDYGTGRCDFPEGCAKDLYHSIHEKLYKLPDSVRFFTGHDYQPGGRELRFESTIGESKLENIQLKESTSEKEYVEFRTTRDKTLNAPKLLLPSIQININGGVMPAREENGVSYLKIPVRAKE